MQEKDNPRYYNKMNKFKLNDTVFAIDVDCNLMKGNVIDVINIGEDITIYRILDLQGEQQVATQNSTFSTFEDIINHLQNQHNHLYDEKPNNFVISTDYSNHIAESNTVDENDK